MLFIQAATQAATIDELPELRLGREVRANTDAQRGVPTWEGFRLAQFDTSSGSAAPSTGVGGGSVVPAPSSGATTTSPFGAGTIPGPTSGIPGSAAGAQPSTTGLGPPDGSALGAPVVVVPGAGTVEPVPEVPMPEPVPETSNGVVPVPLVPVPSGVVVMLPEVPAAPDRPVPKALVPDGAVPSPVVLGWAPGDEPGIPEVGPGIVPAPNGLLVVAPDEGAGTTEPPPTPVLGAADPELLPGLLPNCARRTPSQLGARRCPSVVTRTSRPSRSSGSSSIVAG